MSYPNTDERRAYMREYMRKRRLRKRSSLTRAAGGQCVACGSTKELQFDHIDPSTKEDTVANLIDSSRVDQEVTKCQLLCRPCHVMKTLAERGQKPARGTHGTLSAYRYCKCEECRGAKRRYTRARAERRKHQRE